MPVPIAPLLAPFSSLEQLTKDLESCESFIFDNEADFLACLVKGNPLELLDISFGSTGIHVYWVEQCGQHLTNKISMADFLAWTTRHTEKK